MNKAFAVKVSWFVDGSVEVLEAGTLPGSPGHRTSFLSRSAATPLYAPAAARDFSASLPVFAPPFRSAPLPSGSLRWAGFSLPAAGSVSLARPCSECCAVRRGPGRGQRAGAEVRTAWRVYPGWSPTGVPLARSLGSPPGCTALSVSSCGKWVPHCQSPRCSL